MGEKKEDHRDDGDNSICDGFCAPRDQVIRAGQQGK